ncbi:hypothetical protein JJQ72_16440 [Paenibacillus sp. F411]|uniref:hypothetical protein n=1 Tax=Paenibacillus sp. F411 TaxID=2820239 RepID=UPI001AAF9758|nr:hypothetical protein [Paenibacillus sp. F411]MBO2945568.1 hypothetical protein [Paenibacillus sp. F411]
MAPITDPELQRLEDELREPLTRAIQPPPTPEETSQLISSLQNEFDLLRMNNATIKLEFNAEVEPPSLKQLLLNQLRLNQKSILLAAAAVFCMLVLLIDPQSATSGMNGIPGGYFPLVTPLLLMSSMLFSSRTRDRGMRAVEHITPYPPSLVLYSRLLSVTVMITGLGIISTFLLGLRAASVEYSYFRMGPFLLEWMSVLLLTGGTAMFMLFRKGMGYAVAAALFAYIVWIALLTVLTIDNGTSMLKMPLEVLLLILGGALLYKAYSQSQKPGSSLKGGAVHD